MNFDVKKCFAVDLESDIGGMYRLNVDQIGILSQQTFSNIRHAMHQMWQYEFTMKQKSSRSKIRLPLQVSTAKESEAPAREPAQKGKKSAPKTTYVDVKMQTLMSIIERAKEKPLSEKDVQLLSAMAESYGHLTLAIEQKETTMEKLRRMLFGTKTERLKNLFGENRSKGDVSKETAQETQSELTEHLAEPVEPAISEEDGQDSLEALEAELTDGSSSETEAASEMNGDKTDTNGENGTNQKKKRRGHGRNGASSYTGARKNSISNDAIKSGEKCPECDVGRVYVMKEPLVLVRVTGMAPLSADVYALERLRCNICGEIFSAPSPEGVGEAKYNAAAASMIAMMKYGCGIPFHRLERLQNCLGIPLPAATQWLLVSEAVAELLPAWKALVKEAADGEVLHNDDTVMRILQMNDLEKPPSRGKGKKQERTGVFTTGIISVKQDRKIALFYTGHKHAGENLTKVLSERTKTLEPPIQMCDALSRNTTGNREAESPKTQEANCLAHARREFVDIVDKYPEACEYVLRRIGAVYKHDDEARGAKLSARERMEYHQSRSAPLLLELKQWMEEQFHNRLVEPNSSLGGAIRYMLNHWQKLTLFLRVEGAPLDNNVAERALKKAILHRKNALFYKTANGATVGDLYMALIHTCELNGIDPYGYMVALQEHAVEAAAKPEAWLPWNYSIALSADTTDSQ